MIAAPAPAITVSSIRPAGAPAAMAGGFDAMMSALAVVPAPVPTPTPAVVEALSPVAVPVAVLADAGEAVAIDGGASRGGDADAGDGPLDDADLSTSDEDALPVPAAPVVMVSMPVPAGVVADAIVSAGEDEAAADGGAAPVARRGAALATLAAGASPDAIARTAMPVPLGATGGGRVRMPEQAPATVAGAMPPPDRAGVDAGAGGPVAAAIRNPADADGATTAPPAGMGIVAMPADQVAAPAARPVAAVMASPVVGDHPALAGRVTIPPAVMADGRAPVIEEAGSAVRGDGVARAVDGAALKAAGARRGEAPPAPAPFAMPVQPIGPGAAPRTVAAMPDRVVHAIASQARVVAGGAGVEGGEPANAPPQARDMPIDLAAIFPLAGSAPLAVSFVRPQAGRAEPALSGEPGEGVAADILDSGPGSPAAAPGGLPPMAAIALAGDGGIATAAVAMPRAAPASAEMPIEHHLKAAHEGAWLDRLASDIAASAEPGSPVRFALNGERLGAVKVEIDRRDDGAAVRFTTDSEAARALIADAQPALAAEARTHGLRIAEAQVDVAGQGGGPSPGGQGSPQGGSGMAGGFAQQQQHQAGGQRAAAFERPAPAGARSGSAGPADRPAARAERYA